MKIGILHHGGQTRKMITVEVGRVSKRDIKFESAEAALAHVRDWLNLPEPDAKYAEMRAVLAEFVAAMPLSKAPPEGPEDEWAIRPEAINKITFGMVRRARAALTGENK
jgi:hypothetical protein